MSVLTERVRRALAPDYEVQDEIASGGMGVVYRAHDVALDKPVAIKIIRPDLATAVASQRFLREARALASFHHPNIVPVHRAGEQDGLAYYVMDFLAGETLAERIARGPLPPDEARQLAADLLAALAAVHAHGIVHRDVKPANIFLAGGRAVLADFGVAKILTADEALTETDHSPGTLRYMPPEQLAGADVSARTDQCAAAMVIYEALTGRVWSFDSHTEHADWTGVPSDMVPALRRALAWSPAERWPSVEAFAAALLRPRTGTYRKRAVAAVALVLGLAAWLVGRPHPVAGGLHVAVQPITLQGSAPPGTADSISAQLLRALRLAPDIEFRPASGGSDAPTRVETRVRIHGDSARLTFLLRTADGRTIERTAYGPTATVADSAARELLLAIWRSDTTLRSLPSEALPHSTAALATWAEGEADYARGRWSDAQAHYEDALNADTSCALCLLRLVTITRWLRNSPDTGLTHRLLRSLDRFPPAYAALIRASSNPTDRWGALQGAVAKAPRFDLAHFTYGDELFHRGPLAGFDRALALGEFEQVIGLRQHFAPAFEHLAWIAIAQGDSAAAEASLARYTQEMDPSDAESRLKFALLSTGLAWRFWAPGHAALVTEAVLQKPEIQQFPDLRWSGSYLLVFDAPEGVAWVGRRFETWNGRPDLVVNGLIAQIVGNMALGRMDSAQAAAHRLQNQSSDPEIALAVAEFEAAPYLLDTTGVRAAWPRIVAHLGDLAAQGSLTVRQRRRAAWMLALVARRAGIEHRSPARTIAGQDAPLARLLDGDAEAAFDPHGALLHTEPLLALDSAGRGGDPFFRAALHILRAEWYAAAGDHRGADASLLWYGNYDLVGQPDLSVQAEDADWALGTLARWRRAALLPDDAGPGRCRDLRNIARLWKDGDAPFRARAADAARRADALRCGR